MSINIGITIGLSDKKESIWINGIKMNAIFLADALMQSSKNYNVYLLNTSTLKISLSDPDVELPWDTNKYPVYEYHEKIEDTDLLIQLSTSLTKKDTEYFKNLPIKNRPKKVVGYKCGNNYVIEMQRALYGPKEKDHLFMAGWSQSLDDVWFVPQQEYHNKHYYDVFENVDSKPVPFVWNPMFLDEVENIFNAASKTTKYEPSDKKRIVCFEPNLDVLKYNMVPTLMTELAYRSERDSIDLYTICSGMNIGVRQAFISHITKLDIYNAGLLKVGGRYPMPEYLGKHTDIVVSHQWDNPLNYAYLDAMYLNYPIVHNADMVKDGGYYYKDFNIKMGSEVLIDAIKNHDNNIEDYNKRSDVVISRYMASRNPEIVETYDKLIDNLWDGEHDMTYDYDWKTNSYKK